MMKRIGVTQRVESLPDRGERRDCLDQRWAQLLGSLDLDAVPVPNGLEDVTAWAERQGLEGLILSGGNDLAHLPGATAIAPERDATENRLLDWAATRALPVLGVCRGLQLINHHFGGHQSPVEGHVARYHTLKACADDARFDEFGQVNSYHDWALNPGELAAPLTALARSGDGTIEALRHDGLGWLAIMWHPERESPFRVQDRALIRALFEPQRRNRE
ncbi:MAG: gamma-glutamyl-gamma-aminobutyrate hydrolase family protein [Pseudomonadota bacterium]